MIAVTSVRSAMPSSAAASVVIEATLGPAEAAQVARDRDDADQRARVVDDGDPAAAVLERDVASVVRRRLSPCPSLGMQAQPPAVL